MDRMRKQEIMGGIARALTDYDIEKPVYQKGDKLQAAPNSKLFLF
jgi:hypothetical protein